MTIFFQILIVFIPVFLIIYLFKWSSIKLYLKFYFIIALLITVYEIVEFYISEKVQEKIVFSDIELNKVYSYEFYPIINHKFFVGYYVSYKDSIDSFDETLWPNENSSDIEVRFNDKIQKVERNWESSLFFDQGIMLNINDLLSKQKVEFKIVSQPNVGVEYITFQVSSFLDWKPIPYRLMILFLNTVILIYFLTKRKILPSYSKSVSQ